jgi:hypothetical protein
MSRPLLITDCDEVLLHMVSHFAEWLEAEHRVHFALESGSFSDALTNASGEVLPADQVWRYLDLFFREQMHRQTLVPGAAEALERIGEVADIVVLTNLGQEAHGWRVEQLASHGITYEVVCNQGGKGEPVHLLWQRHGRPRTVFVDDLPVHHASVAKHAPDVTRLHMIAEPRLARAIAAAEHADARIDDWPSACEWILARFAETA